MNKILNTELFRLLSDASEVTDTELRHAYGRFTEHMKTVGLSENDPSEAFRALNVARVELVFLQSLYRHGEEKKRPETRLHPKSRPVS